MTIDWQQVPDGWRLRYHGCSDETLEFTFNREATRLDVSCTLPDTADDIAAVVVGPVMAAAFSLRGVPVLHASAVVVGGKAILIAGPAGAGKSTLTAALVGKGMPLLAEDLAVLTVSNSATTVQPGYPRLRLCADATAVAGQIAANLPLVFRAFSKEDKRWIHAADLAGGFCKTAAPLGAIYLLGPRSHGHSKPMVIIPLPAHRASLALVGNLYGHRWLRTPKPKALEWCAQIAERTPVRIVNAPCGLGRVADSADSIIGDAKDLGTTSKSIDEVNLKY
jgi:hypothetical protein